MPERNCPVCGGARLERKIAKKEIADTFGGSAFIDIVEYSCPDCGTEGDLFRENDAIIEKAMTENQRKVAVNVLDDFAAQGFNLASMERILELPQRTLSKWKTGSVEPSAAGTVLLKFVRTFPWLLKVAEANFEKAKSQQIFLMTAFQEMIQGMRFDTDNLMRSCFYTSGDASIFFMRSERQDQAAVQPLYETSSRIPAVMERG